MRGFTLLEVLMTLSLSIILLTLASINWQHFLEHEHDRYLFKLTSRSLSLAQQAALAREVKIAWSYVGTDLLIFSDVDGTGKMKDKSTLIRQEKMNWHGGQFHIRAYPRYRSYLQFSPDIRQQADNATLWYCRQAKARWALVVNKAGNIQEHLPDNQGDLRDEKGEILACG